MLTQIQQISFDNWAQPLNYFNQFLVSMSNCYINCNGAQFVKQFDIRVSTITGISDMTYSLLYDYFTQGQFYTATQDLIASQNCTNLFKNIGIMIKFIFNYEAPDSSYV